jgi:membrane protease YdiL (CAAX protease family)
MVERESWQQLFIFLLIVIGGFFVSQFAALISILPFFSFDYEQVIKFLENITQYPEHRFTALWMQGVNSIFLFIGSPLFFWWMYEKKELNNLFKTSSFPSYTYFATFVIMLVYMPLSGFLVQLNKQITFPDFMKGVEQEFLDMEKKMEVLTSFMIQFEHWWQFLFGLLVIAVIPAIGEELLFRAGLQRKLQNVFGNYHVAIWASAFIFSAFHMQFYGLIPRMCLGALFGYMFVWSGTIWAAIFAHFLNNAITLTAMYFLQSEVGENKLENPENFPLSAALVSLILVLLALQHFYRYHQERFVRK